MAQDAQFPVGGASISRLVNGMVQRMPGSPIMDRILTRHQLEEGEEEGLATATEFSGVLCTPISTKGFRTWVDTL